MSGDGTALTYTEQGTYLDGIEERGLPEAGTTRRLDNLTGYLQGAGDIDPRIAR